MNKVLLLILLIPSLSLAQGNLVPNPSFEEYTECPITNGQIDLAEPWRAVYGGGGVCYFHECGTDPWGIPENYDGWQYPRTGDAYVAHAFWYLFPSLEGQFSGVPLLSPLVAGKKYHVEFYISLHDSIWYAIKNIGVYFSEVQPPGNINTLLSYEPQVRYTGEEYLNDRVNWTKIEGSFYADGGEQFITIGNFDGHNNTDTVFVPEGGGYAVQPEGFWDGAIYYIDDVSVELDTTVGINELENVEFEVYPNPAKESIIIETEFREQSLVKMFDVTGREVLTTTLVGSKTTIDVSGFAGGVYTAVLLRDDVAVGRRKIIKE